MAKEVGDVQGSGRAVVNTARTPSQRFTSAERMPRLGHAGREHAGPGRTSGEAVLQRETAVEFALERQRPKVRAPQLQAG